MTEQYQIKVTVPDGAKAVGSATLEGVRDEVNERLAEECGGFTVYDADGGWVVDQGRLSSRDSSTRGEVDGDGNLVSEPVQVHTAVGGFEDEISAKAFAWDVAETVKYSTDEDAVIYQVTETSFGLVE